MDKKQLIYAVLVSVIASIAFYIFKEFHEQLKEIEERLDFQAGYDAAKKEDKAIAATPCGCGGH